MSLLHLFSYAAAVIAFLFVTLSLASGLLWLSEVIEERSRSAKIIGKRGIYVIIALHVLLYITDSLPLSKLAFSIFCHVVYLQNFSHTWPLISLTSPSFIASCALVIADHFLWFFHFARVTHDARQRAQRGRVFRPPPGQAELPTFGDMATFFGICVWLAPLFLFLSLSANDHALPTSSSDPTVTPPTPVAAPPRARTPLFRSLVDSLPINCLPGMRPRPRRTVSEGLIAPHSPVRRATSPLPVPTTPTRSLNNIPSPRASSDVFDMAAAQRSPNLTPEFQLSPPPPLRKMSASLTGTAAGVTRRR